MKCQGRSRGGNTIFWLVILMTPLSGMGVDISVATLPNMADFFGVGETITKISVSSYIFGYGLSQVFFGAWSDVVGRRRVLLCATSFFVFISLAISHIEDIEILIVLRFMQGVAVAASTALARAIVTDSFTLEARKTVANYLVVAWGVGPIVAPLIGGLLQRSFDWQGAYYFLAVYGLVLVMMIYSLLPETNCNRIEGFWRSLGNVKHVICSPEFSLAAISAGICLSTLYIFNIFSVFILVGDYNYSPVEYGRTLLFVGSSWLLGSLFNRFFLHIYDARHVINASMLAAMISSITMLVLSTTTVMGPEYGYIAPAFLIIFFSNIVFTRCFGLCLCLFPRMAGIAGALTGTIFIVVGALWTFICSVLGVDTVAEIALIYIISIALILFSHNALANTSRKSVIDL